MTAALAWAEVRLLVRTVTFWSALVSAVGLCLAWSWTIRHRWDLFAANSGMAALVLAGFLLLLGHLAASRDHRHGAGEAARALPAPPARRTVALLAIVLAAGLAGALAQGVQLLVLAGSFGLTGRFDPWLVCVPVVLPMIGAALGVAAGRWLPSTPAGPLTLFGAAAVLAVIPVLGSNADDLPWRLFPVVLGAEPAAATGWHLAYLVALLTAVVGLALLRHWRLVPALVVGLAAAAAAVAVLAP